MNLIIVGAGGLGREIFSWVSHYIRGRDHIKIGGFIDDNLEALKGFNYPVKVVSTISDYKPDKDDRMVLSIAEPRTKKKIVGLLKEKGCLFDTLVYPDVIMGQNVVIGEGCVICPGSILTADIVVGDFAFINTGSTLGHDVELGAYSSVMGNVDITGRVKTGAGCYFGVGAKVIPGRKIGDNSVVGAGSVVIRNVKAGSTVFGNPAKKV